MRIIAGEARGRPLFTPKGQDTRPTQDRVRESLFNILMWDTVGARVLDLFAGSGALALEALSRGAAEAALVDVSADAVACIRRNTETLRFGDRATILHCDWQTALQRLSQTTKPFSLVFLDPPYRMTDTPAQCATMANLGLLQTDALIVIEHRQGETPSPDTRFTLRDARGYGDTAISFYVYREAKCDA